MSSAAFPVAMGAAYAERALPHRSALDGKLVSMAGAAGRIWRARRATRAEALVAGVGALEPSCAALSEQALQEAVADLRTALHRQGFEQALVSQAFALVREAARRAIGQRHYDVQLRAGAILLGGMIAEMETGEGKTLTATLAAATAALAGRPVHVVTVNDYLAARDAEWMRPVYEALGLRVGVIQHGMPPDARRQAYLCDVTYCTNKELAFDYLRDRVLLGRGATRARIALERLLPGEHRLGQMVLRGLCFAIVDEADSVLVDEARTPLILSSPRAPGAERDLYAQALTIARGLRAGEHFRIEPRGRSVDLTDAGREHIAAEAPRQGPWAAASRREHWVRQALLAEHAYQRDQHYILSDEKVVLIDEFTGRTTPDRAWEEGLHQIVEAKEGIEPTGRKETLARISYQRFFRRYLHLAGMTGTAREIARELGSVYGLPVVRVHPHRPLRRRDLGETIFESDEARWRAVVARIAELRAGGRPVLVGTRSVAASEHLARLLTDAGIPHRVLNARQDREEAQTVAEAGSSGTVTVATNMAGRGTDIRLGPGVVELGGLHVIATERHEARRIDRQLFGRCGRQGDPGSYEVLASLEDELVRSHAGPLGRALARSAGGRAYAMRLAQRRAELFHSRIRRRLVREDERLEDALGFAGGGE